MAAAFLVMPEAFACAPVDAWVGKDRMQWLPWLMPRMLLVEQRGRDPDAAGRDRSTAARYCKPAAPRFERLLVDRLTSAAARF